ncbi:hypothetical protein VPHK460_0074 [Vibrio phage K460]
MVVRITILVFVLFGLVSGTTTILPNYRGSKLIYHKHQN